ncbi:uncharacterized protein LOC131615876 [Vicia villosa]|uniref:uncharacterized protein LOC131615876 n=1 Tax=Vicia villosa TaxID=3911 RepID=UPI00273C1C48|nr:uncharacterized protein LOC131615876 [Vicia villosa]
MDVQKRRIRLFVIVAAVIALSITAEKCRELMGEEGSSQSGKFTILNCFDMGSGTVACAVKEGVKLYFYSIRSTHVEKARQRAIETALVDAVSQGMSPTDSANHAQKESKKAAKLASRQAKRIIGPIISSGWDFFEAIYYGGTLTEGFLRGTGTLFGAYGGAYMGEQSLGRIGYLVGSHMGSWVGGRIGLMIYDVVNGVHLLLQFVQTGEIEAHKTPADENFDAPETSFDAEVPISESSESSSLYESPPSESSSLYESSPSEESNAYESAEYQNYESYENSEL